MAVADYVWDKVDALLDSLSSDVESALNELQSIASGWAEYNMPIDIVAGEAVTSGPSLGIASGSTVSSGTVATETAEPVEYDGNMLSSWDYNNILASLPTLDFDPNKYLPTDIEVYSYQSDFFDNFLEDRLKDTIDTYNYFITASIQDAMFDETKKRDTRTLNDSLDASDRMQARNGFPIPNSIVSAARAELIKRYQDTYDDRNKQITALIAERAHTGRMHAIDAGIKMEDIRSRFLLEHLRFYQAIFDAIVRKYIADFDFVVKHLASQLEILKMQHDARLNNSRLVSDAYKTTEEFALRASTATAEHATQASFKNADLEVASAKNALDASITNAEIITKVSTEGVKAGIERATVLYNDFHNRIKNQLEAAAKVIDSYSARITGVSGMINDVDVKTTSA